LVNNPDLKESSENLRCRFNEDNNYFTEIWSEEHELLELSQDEVHACLREQGSEQCIKELWGSIKLVS
jgi:hypothetical protein